MALTIRLRSIIASVCALFVLAAGPAHGYSTGGERLFAESAKLVAVWRNPSPADAQVWIGRARGLAAHAAFIPAAAAAPATGSGVPSVDGETTAKDTMMNLFGTLKSWATASLFEINQTPVTTLGLVRVMLILLAAWWISKIARGGLERVMKRRQSMSKASVYTLSRLFHYGILTIGFFVALSSIGIDFTKFALIVSALGVGIGFGLQAIFSNFVAGLIILFEKSLKIGDFVELESGVHGEVREISIRATLITTNDNIDILVPNSEFVNGRVINWTLREAYRRTRIPFGVAYGTDKELVRKAALEAADEMPFTLKSDDARMPQVWLTEFGDSSLNFELVVWLKPDAVARPGAVHAAYTWAIETALGKYNIEIPFPQRDINVRSFFGEKDEAGLDWMAARTPVSELKEKTAREEMTE